LVGRLVRAGPLALSGYAPGADRMAAARSASLTTAVRMVDRVHGHTAIVRATTGPTTASCLAKRDVAVIRVGDRTDRRHATAGDEPLLPGIQAQDRHALVTTDQLGVSTGGTCDLS